MTSEHRASNSVHCQENLSAKDKNWMFHLTWAKKFALMTVVGKTKTKKNPAQLFQFFKNTIEFQRVKKKTKPTLPQFMWGLFSEDVSLELEVNSCSKI